jgi:hypothetical protein
MAIKQYKINIANRMKRDEYFKSLKSEAPVVLGLKFSNTLENDKTISRKSDVAKTNLVKNKKKSYKDRIENLKKDSVVRGKRA